MIAILAPVERRYVQLTWVIQATEFFIDNLNSCTDADKNAGIRQAVKIFTAGNSSAANAIYQGYDLARQRIKIHQSATSTLH